MAKVMMIWLVLIPEQLPEEGFQYHLPFTDPLRQSNQVGHMGGVLISLLLLRQQATSGQKGLFELTVPGYGPS